MLVDEQLDRMPSFPGFGRGHFGNEPSLGSGIVRTGLRFCREREGLNTEMGAGSLLESKLLLRPSGDRRIKHLLPTVKGSVVSV